MVQFVRYTNYYSQQAKQTVVHAYSTFDLLKNNFKYFAKKK